MNKSIISQKAHVVKKVREFHKFFGLPIKFWNDVESADVQLRTALHREEFSEYSTAARAEDLLDALADMLYICGGSVLTFGIKLRPAPLHTIDGATGWLMKELAKSQLCFEGVTGAVNSLLEAILTHRRYSVQFNIIGAFDEVHRTNMAKLWSDRDLPEVTANGYTARRYGKSKCYVVKRQDGKLVKPPSWAPPNLTPYIYAENHKTT